MRDDLNLRSTNTADIKSSLPFDNVKYFENRESLIFHTQYSYLTSSTALRRVIITVSDNSRSLDLQHSSKGR